MAKDASDSIYDIIEPMAPESPETKPGEVPLPALGGPRLTPVKIAPYKMTGTDKLYYWLRRLGCAALVVMGICWLVFIPYRSMFIMGVGFAMIGAGFGMFLFAGPTDAEKRGYHF